MKNILFLFTKKFPYGIQETYLFDELPYLSASFKEVIIIPHDEFEYNNAENRIDKKYSNIKIFGINAHHNSLKLIEYVNREVLIHSIFLNELFSVGERWNHVKRFFTLTGQLRHLYSSAAAVKKFIDDNDFNTGEIIIYNYWLHRGVIISGILNKILRRPIRVVARAHSFDLYHSDWFNYLNIPNDLFLPFQRWKLKHIDKLYPVSEHGNKHLLRKFPFLNGKTKISRLGGKYISKMSEYASKNDELLFVTCSWGNANKRLYLVPEIIGRMKAKVKWVHFGGADPQQMEEINKRIKKYNLAGSVTLHPRTLHEEILKFYAGNQVDLFLNLSLAEGIPVALMEAASFGIPMVATNTVGNPEIVNEENGFLIEVNFDPEEIAKKLDGFFADLDGVKKKRQASYKTFETLYSADKNYPEFINEIKSL